MHLPTLLIASLVTNLVVCVFLYALYRIKPGNTYFKFWALSCLAFFIACLLTLLRRTDISEFISVFIADLFIVLAPLLLLVGLLNFSNTEPGEKWVRGVVSTLVLLVILLGLTYQISYTAAIISSLTIGSIFFFCAWHVGKPVFEKSLLVRFLQVLFLLHSLVMFSEAAILVMDWENGSSTEIPETMMLILVSHIALTTLTALVLPWISFIKLERHLTRLTQKDSLTGLSNRRHFFYELRSIWVNDSGQSLAILIIDIDHFKKINDTYGHTFGDTTITKVASILQSSVRENDFVARIGGDEFAIIMPGASREEVEAAGERLCQQVAAEAKRIDANEIRLTISVGITYMSKVSDNLEAVLKTADDAMFESKKSGRNSMTFG